MKILFYFLFSCLYLTVYSQGYDVQLVSIENDTLLIGTNTIQVKIKNIGTDTLNSVNLSYSINNRDTITENWNGVLLPTDSLIYSFNQQVLISKGRTYKIDAFLNLGNLVDDDSLNNFGVKCIYLNLVGSYTLGDINSDFIDFNELNRSIFNCNRTDTVFINIKSGDYLQTVYFGPVGYPNYNIYYQGYHDKYIVFQSESSNIEDVILRIIRVSGNNYIFRNLSIVPTKSQYIAYAYAGMTVYGDSITFKNIHFLGDKNSYLNKYGPSMSGAKYLIFDNCVFNNLEIGLMYYNFDTYQSYGNNGPHFVKNCIFDSCSYGMKMTDFGHIFVTNTEFIRNERCIEGTDLAWFNIQDSKLDGITYGILMTNSGGIFVKNNHIKSLHPLIFTGQEILNTGQQTAGNLKFINNMIFGPDTTSYYYHAFEFEHAQNIHFINNSVIGSFYLENLGSNIIFRNNNFFARRPIGYFFENSYRINCYQGDHNNFFNLGNYESVIVVIQDGVYPNTSLSIPSFISSSPFETNSTHFFPFFVNSSSDLHSNSNELDNIGVFDTLAMNDFDFESRFSPNVDIGADEFNHRDSLVDLEITSYPINAINCLGKKDIYVSVKNIIGDTLNAAYINFQSNDTSGVYLLYDYHLAPNDGIDSIFLFSIHTNSDDSTWVKIWVSDVNGGLDMNRVNDTIDINFVTNHGINLGNDTLVFCENSTILVEDSLQFAGYQWHDLSNLSSHTVNIEGTYYVTAVDFDGCVSSDTLIARFNSFVPEIVSKNDTSICENTSVTIDLSQHQNVLYSTLLNGSQYNTDSLLFLVEEGQYIFSITSCANVIMDTFNLNVNELIHANLGNDFSICENEPMYIHADLDLNLLVWNSGQILDSILINQTGIYTYNGFDLNNCPVIPDSIYITINQISEQNLTFNLCQGDSIFHNNRWLSQNGTYHDTLQSTVSCDSIHHITLNLIPSSFKLLELSACNSYYFGDNFYHQSGIYYDTLLNQNSCDSIVELHLTISTIDTVIYDNGFMLYSSAGNILYQWIDCENNTALNWQTLSFFYYPDSSGSYALQVDNGICVDTSACFVVNTASLAQNNDKNALQCFVSPNPSNGDFEVDFMENQPLIEMRIYNMLGELLSFYSFKNVYKIEVESALSQGNYILEINDKSNNSSFYKLSIIK